MKAPSRRMSGVLAAGAVALAVVSGTAGAALVLPTPAFAATTSASELVVDDNYPSLYGWINNKLNDATSIKISTSACGVSDNGNGTTVIPTQVKSMTGWQQYFWESEGKAYDRQLGYASNYETLTFASGSTTTLDHLTLKLLDDHLVIPAGANITFKNCTFTGRVKIETGGKATFENCTFKTATILNNGQASYTGTTKEPVNKGKAQSSFEDLGIVASKTTLNDAVHGHAFQDKVKLTPSGTNAKKATISASIDQADSGLTASVDGSTVTISGTPAAFGTYTATITAVAPDESGNGTQSKSVTASITVHQNYTFTVEGTLDAVRTGQGDYQDSSNHELTVYVTDEAGNKQSYFDFSSTTEGKAYSLKPQISPEGAGLSATLFNAGGKATVTLSGTAGAAGTYQVGATATLGDYTFDTNTVELRIYSGNETLASQIAALSGNPDSWDMEPYEIDRSDNATIPTWLHHIYGSHTSGLYGQIPRRGAVVPHRAADQHQIAQIQRRGQGAAAADADHLPHTGAGQLLDGNRRGRTAHAGGDDEHRASLPESADALVLPVEHQFLGLLQQRRHPVHPGRIAGQDRVLNAEILRQLNMCHTNGHDNRFLFEYFVVFCLVSPVLLLK